MPWTTAAAIVSAHSPQATYAPKPSNGNNAKIQTETLPGDHLARRDRRKRQGRHRLPSLVTAPKISFEIPLATPE